MKANNYAKIQMQIYLYLTQNWLFLSVKSKLLYILLSECYYYYYTLTTAAMMLVKYYDCSVRRYDFVYLVVSVRVHTAAQNDGSLQYSIRLYSYFFFLLNVCILNKKKKKW